MTGTYEWNPMPHRVAVGCPICRSCAEYEFAEVVRIKAEPLQLINGKEKLTLRFDCKPCEMHVVGRIKPQVMQDQTHPLTFHRSRPATA